MPSTASTGAILGSIGLVLSVLVLLAALLVMLRIIPKSSSHKPIGPSPNPVNPSSSTPKLDWTNMPSGTSIKLGYNQPSAAASAVPYALVLDAQCANNSGNCELQPIMGATLVRRLRPKTSTSSDAVQVYWNSDTFELSADH
jgi:hypothetical protein